MRYGRNKCVFKIMNLDFPKSVRFWIMGVSFFHNYYTVFDAENKRIGFATSVYNNLENPITLLGDMNKSSIVLR